MFRTLALASLVVAAAALTGCASNREAASRYPTAFDPVYPPYQGEIQTIPRKGKHKGEAMAAPAAMPLVTVAAPPQAPTAGAIYRDGGSSLALFQDQKARHPGDLLTITLVETTTATATASTTTSKDSSAKLSAPSLFGGPFTMNGRDLGNTDVTGERATTGSGQSAQSNSLQGSVTVTVVQRLSNGNLVVRGDKLIRLNQSDEIVQIMGIVRSADINPDNTIASSRVADVRIAYGGRGALAKANVMGWMSRFFQSPLFPL